jgi:hypothetical protein
LHPDDGRGDIGSPEAVPAGGPCEDVEGLEIVPLRLLIVIAIVLSAPNQASAYGSSQCPRVKAMKAEIAAADVRSWGELFNAYLDYSVCDSGAIAEGFSDSVGRLLSADTVRWSELAGFVRRDDRFLGFIVRHIDETIPATTVDSIEQNAREKCPKSARNICQTVLKACKDLRERVKEEKDGGR